MQALQKKGGLFGIGSAQEHKGVVTNVSTVSKMPGPLFLRQRAQSCEESILTGMSFFGAEALSFYYPTKNLTYDIFCQLLTKRQRLWKAFGMLS